MTKLAAATSITALIGTKIVSTVSLAIAVGMISYSGIVLYDSVYTNREAFISSDLAQYRPVVEEVTEPDFEELQVINTDTCGWLTVGDTHIDYPVVQGEDDLEYSMKDIYGESSLTGSIYLDSENTKDFTSPMNLIYGHHMDNGAMFGDIDKYDDPEYFSTHQDGILVTTHGAYDLHVFARLAVDAYDTRLYSAAERPESDFTEYLYYLKSMSVQWDPSMDIEAVSKDIESYKKASDEVISENGEFVFSEMPEEVVKNGKQLLALSTCRDTSTNGRQVLVATMSFRTEPLPAEMTIEDQEVPLAAWGHGQAEHWALLNLICLVMTIIILLPGKAIIKKIRKITGLDRDDSAEAKADEAKKANEELKADEEEKAASDDKKWQRMLGAAAQVIIAIAALVLFIRTENMAKPMVIVDKWTLAMIVLYAVAWAIDVFIIKYGRKNEDPEDEQDAVKASFQTA